MELCLSGCHKLDSSCILFCYYLVIAFLNLQECNDRVSVIKTQSLPNP